MASALVTVLLSGLVCLVCGFANGQDTSGLQNSVSKHHGSHLAVSRLEQNMNHQMREMERRLLYKLHDKIQKLNASSEIKNLKNLFEFQYEEFSLFRDKERMQQKELADLRIQVSQQRDRLIKQHKDINVMQTSLAEMTSLTRDLNAKLETLMTSQAGGTPPKPTDSSSVSPKPVGKKYPADCEDVYLQGGTKYPGTYYILIQPSLSPQPFEVGCQVTENAGWTLIQRRQDGSVDFYRDWQEYKEGFGNLEGEFWLGLDHIYQLTNQADYRLRVELKTFEGENYWAEYDHFRVTDESDEYRLHVHGYTGDAGDSMTPRWSGHDGQPFSTRDRDHDSRFNDNCAEDFHGAWWFRSCYQAHLNGRYFPGGQHKNFLERTGILWNTVHHHASLKYAAMMVRPNDELIEEEPAGRERTRLQKRRVINRIV